MNGETWLWEIVATLGAVVGFLAVQLSSLHQLVVDKPDEASVQSRLAEAPLASLEAASPIPSLVQCRKAATPDSPERLQ